MNIFQPEPVLTVPVEPIWRLSLDQYHEMVQQGILTPDDAFEFLEGWLVAKMPKNPLHTFITQLLRDMLAALLPSDYFINVQEPLTLADSEPEPDLMVVRGQRWDYLKHHPGAADVALVIEVSDSTLQRDRQLKRQLYAEAGIPLYWLVNVSARQIESFSQPSRNGEYATHQIIRADEAISVEMDGRRYGNLSVHSLFRFP